MSLIRIDYQEVATDDNEEIQGLVRGTFKYLRT